jgi:hypothetical protein
MTVCSQANHVAMLTEGKLKASACGVVVLNNKDGHCWGHRDPIMAAELSCRLSSPMALAYAGAVSLQGSAA